MFKKISAYTLIVALSLISIASYASEGGFNFFAPVPPNSPVKPKYRRFRTRPANPNLQAPWATQVTQALHAVQETQAPDLPLELINAIGLRVIAERYPQARRITLTRQNENTMLSPGHIDTLRSLFPRLQTVEIPSEFIRTQDRENLDRLFPSMCLNIIDKPSKRTREENGEKKERLSSPRTQPSSQPSDELCLNRTNKPQKRVRKENQESQESLRQNAIHDPMQLDPQPSDESGDLTSQISKINLSGS